MAASTSSWADPRYYFGFGYGADINGLGAQGDPRGADVRRTRSTYPFTGLGGVTVDKQRSGERVYDINVDGVAHYGLYPDWVQDLRKVAGGTADRHGHGARRRGLPADVGAGRRGQGERVHDTELAAVPDGDPVPGQGRG